MSSNNYWVVYCSNTFSKVAFTKTNKTKHYKNKESKRGLSIPHNTKRGLKIPHTQKKQKNLQCSSPARSSPARPGTYRWPTLLGPFSTLVWLKIVNCFPLYRPKGSCTKSSMTREYLACLYMRPNTQRHRRSSWFSQDRRKHALKRAKTG